MVSVRAPFKHSSVYGLPSYQIKLSAGPAAEIKITDEAMQQGKRADLEEEVSSAEERRKQLMLQMKSKEANEARMEAEALRAEMAALKAEKERKDQEKERKAQAQEKELTYQAREAEDKAEETARCQEIRLSKTT